MILEKAKDVIRTLDLPTAESQMEFRIANPDLVFVCRYSPAGGEGEVPLLACRFAEFVNAMMGHALFWHDGADWQAQLYPQAEAALAEERYRVFGSYGHNCPVGCGADFKALRQDGADALAVVDLSGVGTRSNMEVHLLRREGREWRLLWVPRPQDFRFTYTGYRKNPMVSLGAEGIDQFTVTYTDGVVETWTRRGTAYVRETAPQ